MANMNSDWWMFHGDAAHTGFTANSSITSESMGGSKFGALYTKKVGGAILSVPAIANGFIYVGTANGTLSRDAGGAQEAVADGGTFNKIELSTGNIAATFHWETQRHEGDTHGFTGMGCTPAIVDGKVYFSAFDGKLRCLDSDTLELIWVTNLRLADPGKNQPVTNDAGVDKGQPQAEGWSSPLVVNGKVYVGMGEGENPDLYAFIYCLDAASGKVIWIFCTNQFVSGVPNEPNLLPGSVVSGDLPAPFKVSPTDPDSKGSVVWSAIAYDEKLNRIFCTTGNPQPDPGLVNAPHYSYGILSLDADTGEECGFYQAPPESNYRCSDIDVDFGGSPVLFEIDGRTVVSAVCKNGTLFVLDAESMTCLKMRQLLPYYNEWLPDTVSGSARSRHSQQSEFDADQR